MELQIVGRTASHTRPHLSQLYDWYVERFPRSVGEGKRAASGIDDGEVQDSVERAVGILVDRLLD